MSTNSAAIVNIGETATIIFPMRTTKGVATYIHIPKTNRRQSHKTQKSANTKKRDNHLAIAGRFLFALWGS